MPETLSTEGNLMGTDLNRHDVWASGDSYERYVGRWSRLIARDFIRWLAVPENSDWLDVGSGTGALSQTILDMKNPRNVKGIDRSEGFVQTARGNVNDARVEFDVGDARELPVVSDTYDVAVSGLVLNFVPEPVRMVQEMKRAIRTGGTAALYVWDYAGKMQMMRHFWNAAALLDPQARDLDEGRRFPICHPDSLVALFREVGFSEIETYPIDINTDFKDFDDYWSPFLGGQGPAPGYVASLSDARRAQLRNRIYDSLPFALDGSIPLVARAWAVKGIK